MTEPANLFPAGRYGRRREARRQRPWVAVALLVVVVVAASLIALRLYRQYGDPSFTPKLTKYQIADRSVTVTFDVNKPDDKGAICGVRARNYQGAEVGSARVNVPATHGRSDGDRDRTTVTYVLATTSRAFAVDVSRCEPDTGR